MNEHLSNEVILAQMERLLSSQVLAGSDQLKRLLRLVVERTLNDGAATLKEYNLGLEVFQRPPDYDPKVDPIVRVQARRLRAKLEEYYAGEGAGDPVRIHIPKGAYAPAFEPMARTAAVATRQPRQFTGIEVALSAVLVMAAVLLLWNRAAPAADPNSSVAVLPLQLFTQDQTRAHIAGQATEVLTTALARNQSLRVVSRTTASQYRETAQGLPEIARALGVRWVVEGGIGFEGPRAYVKLRVVDASSDRKVWADVYDFEEHTLIAVNTRIAAELGAAIAEALRR